MYDSGGFSGFAKSSRLYARPHPFTRQYHKCGFGIYMVHYFLVGPAFLLIGNFNLPIPLQVPGNGNSYFPVCVGIHGLDVSLTG